MIFNNTWRTFLGSKKKSKSRIIWEERIQDLRLIAEGKREDVKRLNPISNQFGLVDLIANQLRAQFGDRGISRYLSFATREMEEFYGKNTVIDDFGTYKLKPGVIATRIFEEIMGSVVEFHRVHQRLENRDINKYTFKSLKRTLEDLPPSKSELKKQFKDKQAAEEDSEVAYNQNGIMAVRPLTTQASCYFGHNPRLTTWCISTKSKRNYFDHYTKNEGRAYVIVRFFGIPEDDPKHIITLEFSPHGNREFWRWWDAPNVSWEPEDLEEAIWLHVQGLGSEFDYDLNFASGDDPRDIVSDIYDQLISSSHEIIKTNPPPDAWDIISDNCERIVREYEDEYEDIEMFYDLERDGEDHGVEVRYGATMSVEVAIPEGPSAETIDWRSLEREADKAIRAQVPVEFYDIDISYHTDEWNDVPHALVELRISEEDRYGAPDVEGFRDFAQISCGAAQKHHDVIESIVEKFINKHAQVSNMKENKNNFYENLENDLLAEEQGRSRQRGIYKFHCMLSYGLTAEENKTRGLDDILADMRALPNVTIVTVAIRNQKIADNRYIAGIAVKFIPSIPGQHNSPEDVKARIVRDIKRLANVQSLFKLSTGIQRLE